MGSGEPFRRLDDNIDHPQQVQTPSLDQFPDGLAIHQLHHQESHSVLLVHVIDLRHRRMIDPGGGAGFLEEPLLAVRVGGQLKGKHLDGDRPA